MATRRPRERSARSRASTPTPSLDWRRSSPQPRSRQPTRRTGTTDYNRPAMQQLQDLVGSAHIEPTAILDIALTALLFYGLFSLIQGTRAVRLVIGAIVLYAIYIGAQAFNLRLLSGVLQTG